MREEDTGVRTETISNTASAMATQIALDVLGQYYDDYYEEGLLDGKYWIWEEEDPGDDYNIRNSKQPTSEGTHTYHIYKRTPDYRTSGNDFIIKPLQTLRFENGLLVEAITASAGGLSSYYRYDSETDTVKVGYYDINGREITSPYYITHNSFTSEITKDKANITEAAMIRFPTKLFINYGITTQEDGSIHLQPEEVRLGNYKQLQPPDDDIIRQRQIPLEDLMAHFIRPQGGFKINDNEEAIPKPLVDTPEFSRLVADVKISNTLINLDLNRKFYGNAHLLDGEIPQWLTFCSFETAHGDIARLFKITFDPTHATRVETNGRTRISCTFIVDGKPVTIETVYTDQLPDGFATNLNIHFILNAVMERYYTDYVLPSN